jgi:predicted nucleic acid-binding protein
MASSTLDQIPSQTRVFVDAPIFIYHFTGLSEECRRFLERCESAEVDGVTSSVVVAEVAHRLMMVEAVAEGRVTPGNVARKLRGRPDLVRGLQRYQDQVERIPLMSVGIVPVDSGTMLRSASVRSEHGLLVNDSLVVTSALDHGATALASSDRDFGPLSELSLYRPADLSGLPQPDV